jgi:hypothetical protein
VEIVLAALETAATTEGSSMDMGIVRGIPLIVKLKAKPRGNPNVLNHHKKNKKFFFGE